MASGQRPVVDALDGWQPDADTPPMGVPAVPPRRTLDQFVERQPPPVPAPPSRPATVMSAVPSNVIAAHIAEHMPVPGIDGVPVPTRIIIIDGPFGFPAVVDTTPPTSPDQLADRRVWKSLERLRRLVRLPPVEPLPSEGLDAIINGTYRRPGPLQRFLALIGWARK